MKTLLEIQYMINHCEISPLVIGLGVIIILIICAALPMKGWNNLYTNDGNDD